MHLMQKPPTVNYDTEDTRRSRSEPRTQTEPLFLTHPSSSSSSVPNGEALFGAHALFMKRINTKPNRTKHGEPRGAERPGTGTRTGHRPERENIHANQRSLSQRSRGQKRVNAHQSLLHFFLSFFSFCVTQRANTVIMIRMI